MNKPAQSMNRLHAPQRPHDPVVSAVFRRIENTPWCHGAPRLTQATPTSCVSRPGVLRPGVAAHRVQKADETMCWMLIALPVRPGLCQPARAVCGTGAAHRAKTVHAHRSDAAELQNGFSHLVVARHVLHPAEVPRRRVHGHQQLGQAARQQLVPQRGALAVFEPGLNAKPGRNTRSIKPLSSAGMAPHQVG